MDILRKTAKRLWFLRERIPFLNFPLPCFLPYGNPFFAYGDEIGLKIFFHIPFEENEWRFVSNFLKPGMTFFDIGANQGFYTLLAGKQVGSNGKVFAFEPLPSEIKKLNRNIKVNNLKNVRTEPLAFGSKEGIGNMHVCLDGYGSFSSLRPPDKNLKLREKNIQVNIGTLDGYIDKHKISNVDFIKIDVEGGELEVLRGGKSLFENFRPILMCELTEARAIQWGYSVTEIYKFLESYHYLFFKAIDGGLLEPLKTEGNYDVNLGNLIAVPKEKVSYILDLIIRPVANLISQQV